ncbi:hypothetical protein SAMD00019534_083820 [Acytostelium subglobosum LB1]|uniref:hypothetical protein n=1 Tax=Acytostelium subglobosum LB1 TaxID=1410327 RepID=UPI000644FFFD|nr:hypothetical protein SAMD00019534_083820 [Acytostelium subglobosum LB1]GAM25207.1 hypothetical protein SAMD00019534_083820 [Acytostelium subglobosum LB1]|eukprot:XP_012751727.1 hypothetical protein SAMD00019534_083820 [Acytostelium subglobosum LB1]
MSLTDQTNASGIADILKLAPNAPRRQTLIGSNIDGLYLLANGLAVENITQDYPTIDAPFARILYGLRPAQQVAPAPGAAGGGGGQAQPIFQPHLIQFSTNGSIGVVERNKKHFWVDRLDQFSHCLDLIKNGQLVLLGAPRSSGKTTIINDISFELQRASILPI